MTNGFATSSMGRLTLNVPLSFAQFEREVIGERVVDKIARDELLVIVGAEMRGPILAHARSGLSFFSKEIN
jgi:hypothetical protein